MQRQDRTISPMMNWVDSATCDRNSELPGVCWAYAFERATAQIVIAPALTPADMQTPDAIRARLRDAASSLLFSAAVNFAESEARFGIWTPDAVFMLETGDIITDEASYRWSDVADPAMRAIISDDLLHSVISTYLYVATMARSELMTAAYVGCCPVCGGCDEDDGTDHGFVPPPVAEA